MRLFFRRLFSAAKPGSLATLICGAAACMAGPALAQQPHNWQLGLQAAHSPVKVQIAHLNDLVTVIIVVITLLVAGLLGVVIWRFRASVHPVPSQTSHNSVLEVAWTILPVLILVIIAIPSFRLIYYENRDANADMTIKVTGHQWYWEYTYPDQGNIDFTSYMVPENQLKPGQKRLLDVDNQLVLPAGKKVRFLISSGDVIHSWFVPSLGVQRYAIPGRVDEAWAKIDKPGVYYGECNQICGMNHSFMPISVRAVTPAEFTAWVAQAKTKFAADVPAVPAAPALAQVPTPRPASTPAPGVITVAQVQP